MSRWVWHWIYSVRGMRTRVAEAEGLSGGGQLERERPILSLSGPDLPFRSSEGKEQPTVLISEFVTR